MRHLALILVVFLAGCQVPLIGPGGRPPIDPIDVPFVCYNCPVDEEGRCCPFEGGEGVPAFKGHDQFGDQNFYCNTQTHNAQCGGSCPPPPNYDYYLVAKDPYYHGPLLNIWEFHQTRWPSKDALCFADPDLAEDFFVHLSKATGWERKGRVPCEQDSRWGEGYTVLFGEGPDNYTVVAGTPNTQQSKLAVGTKLSMQDLAHRLNHVNPPLRYVSFQAWANSDNLAVDWPDPAE